MERGIKLIAFVLIVLGITFLEISILLPFSTELVNSASSNDSVRVELTVGATTPEVINVTLDGGSTTFDLTANTTTSLVCNATIRDWNGEEEINGSVPSQVIGHLFDINQAGDGSPLDNNDHYVNTSCAIDTSIGDAYEALASCNFDVQYYSNNATWSCNVTVTDITNRNGTNNDTIDINELLAVEMPAVMHFGTVNVTDVSFENITNVRNAGNVDLDIVLDGYGDTDGDGLAMNCSLGSIKNISIDFLKFNLTNSTRYVEITNLTYFEANYVNLSDTATAYNFSLNQRVNDISDDGINATWWRIYVPAGVAGTCNGFVNFGAKVNN